MTNVNMIEAEAVREMEAHLEHMSGVATGNRKWSMTDLLDITEAEFLYRWDELRNEAHAHLKRVATLRAYTKLRQRYGDDATVWPEEQIKVMVDDELKELTDRYEEMWRAIERDDERLNANWALRYE
jgi:hypothetical protein